MYRSSPFRSTLHTGYITALDMCEVRTEAVRSVALWTRATLQLCPCVKYVPRSSPFRSTLNTGYITALDMCEVRTETVRSVALWTRVTYSFGHVWSMYRSSPFRSTLNTGYITALDMCEVCTEAVHSVALWRRVTLQLWTCVKFVPKQSVLQHFEHGLHYSFGHVWNMYRSSPVRSTLNTGYIAALDMCEVRTEAVRSAALWTRVTLQLWTCVKYVPKQSSP